MLEFQGAYGRRPDVQGDYSSVSDVAHHLIFETFQTSSQGHLGRQGSMGDNAS